MFFNIRNEDIIENNLEGVSLGRSNFDRESHLDDMLEVYLTLSADNGPLNDMPTKYKTINPFPFKDPDLIASSELYSFFSSIIEESSQILPQYPSSGNTQSSNTLSSSSTSYDWSFNKPIDSTDIFDTLATSFELDSFPPFLADINSFSAGLDSFSPEFTSPDENENSSAEFRDLDISDNLMATLDVSLAFAGSENNFVTNEAENRIFLVDNDTTAVSTTNSEHFEATTEYFHLENATQLETNDTIIDDFNQIVINTNDSVSNFNITKNQEGITGDDLKFITTTENELNVATSIVETNLTVVEDLDDGFPDLNETNVVGRSAATISDDESVEQNDEKQETLKDMVLETTRYLPPSVDKTTESSSRLVSGIPVDETTISVDTSTDNVAIET